MKSKKIIKGRKGYLEYQKKKTLIWTIILFLSSLGIFLLGYFHTGSKENYMTIIAVLGCLPACRSVVNTIMLYRYHGISESDYQKILPLSEGMMTCCDLVFTSYDKNFEIHHMALCGDTLIGYTANSACDAKACEKHLHELFIKNSLREIDITIFKELSKYTNRLNGINSTLEAPLSEEQVNKTETIRSLLCALSL